MVGGVHRKSRRHRNARARTRFSGLSSDSERRTKVVSKIKEAQYLYSLPKRPKLRILLTKMTRDPCRRRIGDAVPRAFMFGDLITADHKVLYEKG